jgi:hypothetical protein
MRILFILLLLTATARPALAQPAEAGAGVGGVHIRDIDFLQPERFGPSAEFRLTAPLTRRFAIEGTLSLKRETAAFERRTRGLYSVQLRQTLLDASSTRVQYFVTYGSVGSFAHVSSPRFSAYDEVEPPLYGIIGAGGQRRLGERLAVRADAQLLTVLWVPLGVRVSAGVSLPFGRYVDD